METQKELIIVCPLGKKGGQLVLALLCSLLIERGINAKLLHIPYEPTRGNSIIRNTKSVLLLFWFRLLRFQFARLIIKNNKEKCPFGNIKESFFPFLKNKNTIVLYPERVYGNPFFCKNVIRYFMYYNPYPNDPNAYGNNDLFLTYRKIFNDFTLNPNCNEVCLNHFDNLLYRQINYGVRSGNCYIIRKGKSRIDLPMCFDGIVIDELSEEEKVRVLNKCIYCFSYDTQTFYTTIAAVCGCIPIIVMEPGKNKNDYVTNEDKTYGVAYGNNEEEINYAIGTRNLLLSSLNFSDSNNRNIDEFVRIVSDRFGELINS